MASNGIMEIILRELSLEDRPKVWMLSMDVEASLEDLMDLQQRIRAELQKWVDDRSITIIEGEGPDGTRYGVKPN